MAIIQWHKNFRTKGTLTYSLSERFRGGHWLTVFDKAVTEFNQQMSQHGLKLALSKVEKGKGPHIRFDTETGNGLHGQAPTKTTKINRVEYNDEVTILVPATPRVDRENPKSREMGPGVRLCLLVHEMIHAVGLSNDEHAKDDVFSTKGVVIQKGHDYHLAKKNQNFRVTEDKVQPPDLSEPMPPVRIGATTLTNLKKAWSVEETKPAEKTK
jgi:hypothetical protein